MYQGQAPPGWSSSGHDVNTFRALQEANLRLYHQSQQQQQQHQQHQQHQQQLHHHASQLQRQQQQQRYDLQDPGLLGGLVDGYARPVMPMAMRQQQVPGQRVVSNRQGLMLPPSTMRNNQLQQEKAKAAQRRQQEQARQKAKEDRANAVFQDRSLFAEPIKVNSNESSRQVSSILGDHNNAAQLISGSCHHSSNNVIGVDYLPPTPAPVTSHHIICGEEDEEPTPEPQHRMGRPPGQFHQRQARPSRPPVPSWKMAPPPAVAAPPAMPTAPPPAKSSPILESALSSSQKAAASRIKPKLPKLKIDQPLNGNVHDIIREMENPLANGGFGSMPPPLTAIETPRVGNHEGNNAKSVPRYFSGLPNVPLSPPKPPIQSHAIEPRLSEESDTEVDKRSKGGEAKDNKPKPVSSSDTSESESSDSESSSDELANKKKTPSAITTTALSENNQSEMISASADNDDQCFSLTNLLGKVKSTHSPGPQPSPKLSSQVKKTTPSSTNRGRMSSNRDDEDEGDPIDSMLSNTPNNLQDLIDRATTDDGLIKSPSQFSTDQGYHNNLKAESSDDEHLSRSKRRSKKHAKYHKRSRESPSSTPSSNKPMPRHSALASSKRDTSQEKEEDEIIDKSLLDIQQSYSKRKRKANRPSSSQKVKKDEEIYVSSSTVDEDDTKDEDWKESKKKGRRKSKAKEIKSPLKERVVASSKKAAMSMIFASTIAKAGGIKVERHRNDNSDSDEPVLRREVTYRKDKARPILMCKIPMGMLSYELSQSLLPSLTESRDARRSHKKRHLPQNGDSEEDETSSSSSSRKRRKRDKRRPSSDGFRASSRDKNSRTASSHLMPPPDDSYEDLQGLFDRGQELRAEADRELAPDQRGVKHLKAALQFILWGYANEHRGDKGKAFAIYKDTLDHVKRVTDIGHFDNKLAVLSLRCQSLLHLKLYKIKSHELQECQKIIGEHIQKASTSSQQNSPTNGGNSTISPTPSPAGSEGSVCSKSSGYTSSGELNHLSDSRGYGVPTPPANHNMGACISVPSSTMQKQHQLCSHLSQCHELWERADLYISRGHCQSFLAEFGGNSLTLHSSLKDLVKYTQRGLEILGKVKEEPRS